MKTIPIIITFACLLFLCSCATVAPPQPPVIVGTPITPATQLPPTQDINKDAGRDSLVFVNIGLEDGEKIPFAIDTGSPITILDESLEFKLGECLDKSTFNNFGSHGGIRVYAAPKLYLGGVPLVTESNVWTMDLKYFRKKGGPHLMGILGMDCMKHYCIQLDFEARKMRFLDSNHLNTNQLGRPFLIVFSTEGQDQTNLYCPFIPHSTLFGEEVTNLEIDVGCDMDGGMNPQLLEAQVRKQGARMERTRFNSGTAHSATFHEMTWSGQSYTNVTFRTWPARVGWSDLIGLNFMARHLVTLDFPDRMMYLKQRSVGSLDDQQQYLALSSALTFVMDLIDKDRLPGATKGGAKRGHGTLNITLGGSSLDACDCQAQKTGDTTVYHYTITRASEDSPWGLAKAWQTNATGKVIKEYPIQ